MKFKIVEIPNIIEDGTVDIFGNPIVLSTTYAIVRKKTWIEYLLGKKNVWLQLFAGSNLSRCELSDVMQAERIRVYFWNNSINATQFTNRSDAARVISDILDNPTKYYMKYIG